MAGKIYDQKLLSVEKAVSVAEKYAEKSTSTAIINTDIAVWGSILIISPFKHKKAYLHLECKYALNYFLLILNTLLTPSSISVFLSSYCKLIIADFYNLSTRILNFEIIGIGKLGIIIL